MWTTEGFLTISEGEGGLIRAQSAVEQHVGRALSHVQILRLFAHLQDDVTLQ